MLDVNRDPLELRGDPNGMAPERLLVFELTGDASNFARAATRVPGLEFLGAEDLDPDDDDEIRSSTCSSLTLPRCDNFSVSGVIGSQTEPFPPGSRRGGHCLCNSAI